MFSTQVLGCREHQQTSCSFVSVCRLELECFMPPFIHEKWQPTGEEICSPPEMDGI